MCHGYNAKLRTWAMLGHGHRQCADCSTYHRHATCAVHVCTPPPMSSPPPQRGGASLGP